MANQSARPSPPRVHDLLRIEGAADLGGDRDRPQWVQAALERAPWVVVRRAHLRDGLIPIGVRGATRSLRHAAWLPPARIRDLQAPEALAARTSDALRSALEQLDAIFSTFALPWGPTGSAGFELASGVPAMSAANDLDVMVRAERLPLRRTARELQQELLHCALRIDCLIELPAGAVALHEYADGGDALILRTPSGPQRMFRPAQTHGARRAA